MEIKTISSDEFKEIYSKVPRICVEVIMQNEKGVLLTKRSINPWNGLWHFPGGGINHGETIAQAVKRVAKEELGLDVEMGKILGVLESLDDEERLWLHPISLGVSAKAISGEIKLDYQASEFDYFKEIPENTVKCHKKFIEENLL